MLGREDKIRKTVAETVTSCVSAGKALGRAKGWGLAFPALMGFLPKLSPLGDDL